MEAVSPTRSELLARRAQIALARQGRDLLEEKRGALLKELLKTLEEARRMGDAVETSMADARRALAWAVGGDGREAVESAAFAARRTVTIMVSSANIVGVQVPVIEQKQLARTSVQRGYSLRAPLAGSTPRPCPSRPCSSSSSGSRRWSCASSASPRSCARPPRGSTPSTPSCCPGSRASAPPSRARSTSASARTCSASSGCRPGCGAGARRGPPPAREKPPTRLGVSPAVGPTAHLVT